jgi:hypothetical protein
MLKSKDNKRLRTINQGLTGNNKASRRLMIMVFCLCWALKPQWAAKSKRGDL